MRPRSYLLAAALIIATVAALITVAVKTGLIDRRGEDQIRENREPSNWFPEARPTQRRGAHTGPMSKD